MSANRAEVIPFTGPGLDKIIAHLAQFGSAGEIIAGSSCGDRPMIYRFTQKPPRVEQIDCTLRPRVSATLAVAQLDPEDGLPFMTQDRYTGELPDDPAAVYQAVVIDGPQRSRPPEELAAHEAYFAHLARNVQSFVPNQAA